MNEPNVEALKQVGRICCTVGILFNTHPEYDPHGTPADAVKLWEAAFVLGERLYDERLTCIEMFAGHDVMQNAGHNLLNYYIDKKDIARSDAITHFVDEEGAYNVKLYQAAQIIMTTDENFGGRYAGDVFAIAGSSTADPVFRVEALKHIGNYRFNASTRGDQLAARKALTKILEDSSVNPAVKAAATAAHDLTLQKHNTYG